jgi:hypothetical protein
VGAVRGMMMLMIVPSPVSVKLMNNLKQMMTMVV